MRRLTSFGWSVLGIAVLGGAAGCLHDDRPSTDRGAAGFFETTKEIPAPLQDRCVKHGQSAVRAPCDDARYLAERWVRGLSTGDPVCLEGGIGDPNLNMATCLARSKVIDAATNRVLIRITDPQPSSRWYKYVGTEVWFQEGALVDLYLDERGY